MDDRKMFYSTVNKVNSYYEDSSIEEASQIMGNNLLSFNIVKYLFDDRQKVLDGFNGFPNLFPKNILETKKDYFLIPIPGGLNLQDIVFTNKRFEHSFFLKQKTKKEWVLFKAFLGKYQKINKNETVPDVLETAFCLKVLSDLGKIERSNTRWKTSSKYKGEILSVGFNEDGEVTIFSHKADMFLNEKNAIIIA